MRCEQRSSAQQHRLAGDGDLDGLVAVRIDDGAHRRIDVAEAARVLAELDQDRRRLLVGRDQRVVVHRVGAIGVADFGCLLGRRRRLLHQREDLHAVGRAFDVARAPRGQAQQVLADHPLIQRERFGDLCDLGQDLGLEDVAVTGGDADHHRVFVAEELLDGVGGDDEGVALREGLVGIDDHL